MLRRATLIAALIRTFGALGAIDIGRQLHFGRAPIRFTDQGRQYLLARDRATPYHLVESTPKLRRLARFVRPGDRVVVDVGAHSGLFGAFASERAPKAHVLCIEPNAEMEGIIRANMASASSWQLIVAAVTNETGTVPFYASRTSTQTSSLVRGAVESAVDVITVPAVTLDDVCAHLPRVDVLKIDVQGAEGMVLDGGQATLTRTRTVLVEVTFLDPDPIGVLARLREQFGPWRVLNPVHTGADLVFERAPITKD